MIAFPAWFTDEDAQSAERMNLALQEVKRYRSQLTLDPTRHISTGEHVRCVQSLAGDVFDQLRHYPEAGTVQRNVNLKIEGHDWGEVVEEPASFAEMKRYGYDSSYEAERAIALYFLTLSYGLPEERFFDVVEKARCALRDVKSKVAPPRQRRSSWIPSKRLTTSNGCGMQGQRRLNAPAWL